MTSGFPCECRADALPRRLMREGEGLLPSGVWGDLGPGKRHWGAEVPSQQDSALPVPPVTPALAEGAGAGAVL